MQRVVLAPAAEEDIVEILAWCHEHFGEPARIRYEALLPQAFVDIADNPERVGSKSREELADGACTYHLWHNRQCTEKAVGMVARWVFGIECSIEILAKIQRIAEFRRKPVLIKPLD